ncbi:permease prefix domain 1-containing protein [Paraclostridium dentum]|uniref:permease prefix domain 1-containing protein n=1 Tax=Paraclostridium dentum TaxID=2662455 RepID=UPI0006917849|nr:permease prefix domain 1-containing protein [Paraclostridium dentum]
MKIIDEYLKSLYKNDKSKEVKELKEELREHLITSTNEFIDNGYSEEDAQREAINQFDGGTEMLKDLHKSLKESKKDNEKLNKKIVNIFRNMFIISLILWLATMVYCDRLVDKLEFISPMLGGEIYKAGIAKRIDKPETYKKQIEDILKSKDFKYVRYLEINPDPDKKPIYRYTDNSNQTESIAIRGQDIGPRDKNGKAANFEIGVDYRPVLRTGSFLTGIFYVGIITLITYIVLLIRYKIKFRKKLIYREV